MNKDENKVNLVKQFYSTSFQKKKKNRPGQIDKKGTKLLVFLNISQ